MGGANKWVPENRNSNKKVVTLKIWAGNSAPLDRWRTHSAVEAAQALNKELRAAGKDITIKISAKNDPAGWGDFKKKFLMAADSHLAPDIICTGHEDIAAWATSGLIVPIAESVEAARALSPAFADVREELWSATLFRGKVWGVPQDTEARVLFFSKPILKKMGWSSAEINKMVRRINAGDFTLDDMIVLAQEAIHSGAVAPGHGYWPRPTRGGDHLQKYYAFGGRIQDAATGKLVADKDALRRWFVFQRRIVTTGITPKNYPGTEWGIWHNTVMSGKVLFWEGGIWNWSQWAEKYTADLGGQTYLEKNVGYAWPPSAASGVIPTTMSHPLVYLLTRPRGTGQRQQHLALRLLALMTTPEHNTKHALSSSHLAVLKSQLSYKPYRQNRFLFNISRMADSTQTFFQPNHTRFSQWFDVVMGAMEDAQSGHRSPAEAADEAVSLMRLDVSEEGLVIR